MSKPRFDELRERLLRAGIGPSHVRRYVRELREHYHDLYRAELARGLPPKATEHAARTRLGSDDVLAESMLARPELRSIAARFPALVFGAAPLLIWLALATLAVVALRSGGAWYEVRSQVPLDRLVRGVELTCLAFVRVLPVLVSAGVFWSAMRRRSRALWPITGAAVVTLVAASITVSAVAGQVGLSTSLLPGFSSSVVMGYRSNALTALAETVARASWMLALTLVPYGLWVARRTHDY